MNPSKQKTNRHIMRALLPKRYGTFARYCVIGALASVIFFLIANSVDALLHFLLKHFFSAHIFSIDANYLTRTLTLLATFCGSLASMLFSYIAQMRLAFRATPKHSTMLPRYCILLALIALYAQLCAYIGAHLALPYIFTSIFIALSIPLFSYPLQKYWVFATQDNATTHCAHVAGGGGGITHATSHTNLPTHHTRKHPFKHYKQD